MKSAASLYKGVAMKRVILILVSCLTLNYLPLVYASASIPNNSRSTSQTLLNNPYIGRSIPTPTLPIPQISPTNPTGAASVASLFPNPQKRKRIPTWLRVSDRAGAVKKIFELEAVTLDDNSVGVLNFPSLR